MTTEKWLTKARKYAVSYLTKYRFMTSDEVIQKVGHPGNSGIIGKVFQASTFENVGVIKSSRPLNRGRNLYVWTLAS